MKKVITLLSLLLLTCLLPASVHALTYSYSTFDYPESLESFASDINNLGNIVGRYSVGSGWIGYQYDASTDNFTSFVCPYTTRDTTPYGINDSGDIVGGYWDGTSAWARGFLKEGSTYTRIDYPATDPTNAYLYGINNSDKIVGQYYVYEGSEVNVYGFTKDGAVYNSFGYPEAGVIGTGFSGINDYDKIVGHYTVYTGSNILTWGFLFDGVSYMPFRHPSDRPTIPSDINDSDKIVGRYRDDSGYWQGFLMVGTDFYPIEIPGALETVALGINNSDIIVGLYMDADYNDHGFIATPVPAEKQIEDIQEFFDDSVVNGELVGLGPTETASAGKLNAFGNMLEEAEYLIDIGSIEEACDQLNAIYMKTDGASPPPDFVTGDAAAELANQILDLIDTLGCD